MRNLGKEQKIFLEETFVAPKDYPTPEERALMDGAPPFEQFPDGIYILGTRGFKRLLGFSATSQIDSYVHSQNQAQSAHLN